MPLTALTLVVPPSDALPGFEPNPIVMLAFDDVTVVPLASCTATCSAGVIALSIRALLGCTVNASFVAAPGLTTCARAALMELAAFGFGPPPVKHPVMLCVPLESEVVVYVNDSLLADPSVAGWLDRTVPPLQLLFGVDVPQSTKSMWCFEESNVHDGEPVQVTVALKVTDCPKLDGFTFDVMLVDVFVASVKLVDAVRPEEPVAVTL